MEAEGLDAAVADKTTRWLPDGMAFVTETAGDGGGDQTGASESPETADGSDDADGSDEDSASGDPEHELPAFLRDNAA